MQKTHTKVILNLMALLVGLGMICQVQATVVTSGCLSASSCTLAELYGGASITINDVVFDAWQENINDGGLDPDSVVVSGVDEVPDGGDPNLSSLGLMFTANPSLAFEFLEYDFDFNSYFNIAGRSFIGAHLQIDDFSLSNNAFVELNAALNPGLLTVDQDDTATALPFGDTGNITADFDIQMETFDDNSAVSLTRFTFLYDIFTPTSTHLPEPTGLLLLLSGLLGLLCRHTRL